MARSNNRQYLAPQGGPAPTEFIKTVLVQNDIGGFDPLVAGAQQGESYPTLGPLATGCTPVAVDRVIQDGPFKLSVVLDMNDNTVKQAIFTVPAQTNDGRNIQGCYISAVTVRNPSLSLDTATGHFGFNANADNSIVGPIDFSDLVDADSYDILPVDLGAKRGTAGQVFGFKVTTEQGAPATVICDVFGYLVASGID